jgi:DNA-binding NarL/FixJ family response regulator
LQTNMSIRISIVEDDEDLRGHFESIVQGVDDFQLLGSYSMAEDFMAHFKELKPDVVLIDINLPGISGIECIRQLKPLGQEVQYLVCTIFEDSANLFNAFCAGATGYILKISTVATIERSIRDIHAGGSPMTPQIARLVINAIPGRQRNDALFEKLTKREQEVLELLAEGFRYKEIADRLYLGVDTVRTYIRTIYSTLQVHSRTDAINKVFGK